MKIRHEKYQDNIDWINISLKTQKPCVMYGGHATHYFNLEHGTPQGDPIQAYLFKLVFEILFIHTKSNTNIHGIITIKYEYFYTAYADDATFLKRIKSCENFS